jgi:hypothetical protein
MERISENQKSSFIPKESNFFLEYGENQKKSNLKQEVRKVFLKNKDNSKPELVELVPLDYFLDGL